MSSHIDFKLGVAVWSLELPDDRGPCDELVSISRLIGALPPTRSPAELYPSDSPMLAVSTRDSNCFISVDLRRDDPTDQMEVVVMRVRCNENLADQVEHELRQIRVRSEVQTAFLRYPANLTGIGV